ncbi:MAG: ATP-binding protein [Desulfobacterales bacterium]
MPPIYPSQDRVADMWSRINLRYRIYLIVGALVLVTLIGGLVTVWYSFRMERLLSDIVLSDIRAFETASSLENSLINQKGFVSYYFLDRNPDWLKQLGSYRQVFSERLEDTRRLASTPREKAIVERIAVEYEQYIRDKDEVIRLYQAGQLAAGAALHPRVRERFFTILDFCEQHRNLHRERIFNASRRSHQEARRLRAMVGVALSGILVLGIAQVIVLMRQIFVPLLRLAEETGVEASGAGDRSVVDALTRGIHGLKEDFNLTHSELERSREHLLQAEKMALVGKLAAGMAHSIRNPFTSVKMRLFSLSRSLEMTLNQKEDFEVISEEIRHIDTIVQNFLEFSRPPKLVMQRISPSTVVDQVIQLLEYRLKSYEVTVTLGRIAPLPAIFADPEQLKEVFVNIIINACEAMDRGGQIHIREEEGFAMPLKRVAVLRISDSGPGINASVIGKVFNPFFTTKNEGTGLGLSIAARIIEEHKGWLDVTSDEAHGACFIVTLPLADQG